MDGRIILKKRQDCQVEDQIQLNGAVAGSSEHGSELLCPVKRVIS
jgi:hypothetical protein